MKDIFIGKNPLTQCLTDWKHVDAKFRRYEAYTLPWYQSKLEEAKNSLVLEMQTVVDQLFESANNGLLEHSLFDNIVPRSLQPKAKDPVVVIDQFMGDGKDADGSIVDRWRVAYTVTSKKRLLPRREPGPVRIDDDGRESRSCWVYIEKNESSEWIDLNTGKIFEPYCLAKPWEFLSEIARTEKQMNSVVSTLRYEDAKELWKKPSQLLSPED